MKLIQPFLLLAVVAATYVPASAANASPRVTRPMLVAMEKSLDSRVTRLSQDNPFVLLGPTRGIYLEGYGAVFTAEINLVSSPGASMMLRTVTHQGRESSVTARRRSIGAAAEESSAQALARPAASLDTVPGEEQIVVGSPCSRVSLGRRRRICRSRS